MNEPTSLGEWLKVSDLGSGSFGTVQLWKHQETDETVAIKKCRFQESSCITQKQRERWRLEVAIMKQVNHPNIVAFKNLPDAFHKELEKYNYSRLPILSMEYCTGGSLRTLMKKDRHMCGLREYDVRRVLEDMANAVEHLHKENITHRDIKPENVVLHINPGFHVTYKLIDLGYAKDMNALASFVGTLAYTAPEIFMNEEYNHNVDYWSFGIMVYELCCGMYPFMVGVPPVQRFDILSKKGPRDICVYKIADKKVIHTDKIMEPNYISPRLRTHLEDWLSSMLQYDKANRGITQYGTKVFTILKNILNKQILHVFVVYNYTHLYYEVTCVTKLEVLQSWIHKSTGLIPTDQLLLATSQSIPKSEFYTRLNEPGCKVVDLGLSTQSTLVVLKRGHFIHSEPILLPPVVKNLFNIDPKVTKSWTYQRMELSHVAHFIETETRKMQIIRVIVHEIFEYLHYLLEEQGVLLPDLQEAGRKALQLVEFCRKINVGCTYDGAKVAAIKNVQNHLRKVKELIENTNAATARYLTGRRRFFSIKEMQNLAFSSMEKLHFDDFNETMLKLMHISKQKEKATPLISSCIKARRDLSKDLTEYFTNCFKVLREYEKLTRWMKALIIHIKAATEDLLNCQKMLSNTPIYNSADSLISLDTTVSYQGNIAIIARDEEELPSAVSNLVLVNKMLRSQMMESMDSLLSIHRSHAINIGEFVEFMDDVDITKDMDQASHSTDV